ncbi:T9SS type A sorting domain-containing protein [Schleiferia thermophila]|uniref:T9SS type A sorting domain-containing protein n=1 Tax=Schleiferia thermophila TaxID=884107 RepID=UPI003EEF6BA8
MKKFLPSLTAILLANGLYAQINIAPQAVASASQCNTGPCSTLNDLDFGTCGTQQMWIPTSNPPTSTPGVDWIMFEWTSPKTFDQFIIHHAQNNARLLTGGLIQRWDGTNWVNHHTFSNLPPACSNQVNFQKVTTTRVRITSFQMTGPGQTSNPNFREWEIISAPTLPNDAGIASLDSPKAFCPGLHPIIVKVANFGTNKIDTVTVNWSMNGIPQTPILFTQTLDTVGGTGPSQLPLTLGTWNFMANTIYQIKVWTSNPNGVNDPFNANDTLNATLIPSISGTYTINSALPTSGTNFQTFTAFANFINSAGVCGPVTVNVAPGSGPYLEKVSFGNISGTSATNTITINGNGAVLNFFSPNTNDRITLELNGTKYMTIDSLTIRSDSGAQGFSVLFRNGADWNVVRNCSIISNTTSTSTVYAGIAFSNSTTSATTAGLNGNNNLIERNVIIGGYYGITVLGSSSTARGTGNSIIRNTIRDFYLYGIYALNQDNFEIFGNDISRPTRTTISTFYGFYQGTSGSGVKVFNNRIHNAHGAAPYTNTFTAYPIFISVAAGTANSPNVIANNLIYDIQTNGVYYGIYLSGTTDHTKIFHNTIVFNTISSSSSTTRLIWVAGTPTAGCEVRNNLLYLSRPGTGERFLTYLTSNTNNIRASNNAYFKDPNITMSAPTFFRGASFNTLQDFQNAGADSNSVFTDPQFINMAQANYRPLAPQLNSMGKNLGGLVPFDFDSMPRSFLPDPGVYEFDPPPGPNPGLTAFIQPSGALCGDSADVVVRAVNVGQDTVNTLTISWTVNTITQNPVTWNGVLATGNFVDIILGKFAINSSTIYDLTATITASGPGVDTDPSNNSIERLGIRKGLAGTYTINALSAPSGTNFVSFNDFASAVSSSGVCGPITVNVTPFSGPYTEQVAFNNITSTSSVNTIKINGNGNVLQFTSTNTSQRSTLTFNNCQWIEIDSLEILSLGNTTTQFGTALFVTGNSQRLKFNKCRFEVNSTLTSLNYNPVVIGTNESSPTAIGKGGDYIEITNSIIRGGYYGLSIGGGSSSTDLAVGNKIENCLIEDFYVYGTYIRGQDSMIFNNNDISRAGRTTVTTFYGITLFSWMNNSVFSNNRVRDSHTGSTTANTTSMYPLYISGSTTAGHRNRLFNNLVYNMNSGGLLYALYMLSSQHWDVYHNTIVVEDALFPGTGTNAAAFFTGTFTNVDVRNNLFVNTRTNGGTKYVVYQGTANTGISYNNNGYFSDQNNVWFHGSALNDFAAWQATGKDQNSVFANPGFLNPGLNDYTPSSGAINNIGANLLSIVSTDINGTPRTTTPDPGAIEFAPLPCTGAWAFQADSVYPTGALLSWQSTADTFQIEWGPVGFTPATGQGTLINNITSKSYNLTPLPVGVCFHVYLREICDNAPGVLTGPIQFCTPLQFDAELLDVIGLSASFCGDSSTSIQFVVKNNGFDTINNLPYGLIVSGDITQTITGTYSTPIPPNATDTISVATINTSNGGLVQSLSYVNLTNDQVTANDSIQTNMVIIPAAPQALPATACAGDTSATLIGRPLPGVGYEWYNAPTGGTPISMSDTLVVSNLAATYYLAYQESADSLLTTIAAGNSQNGNMFDVDIKGGSLTITGFTVSPNTTGQSTFEIYHRPGTHVGFENSAAGWTLLQTFNLNVTQTGPFTKLTFTNPITLSQGTHAFYVTRVGASVNYTNGTAVGNILASHPRIDVKEGVGKSYPFGSTFSPRNFNGYIHFGTEACSDVRTPVTISIIDTPTVSFTYTITNYTVSFTSQTTHADSLYWNFGGAGNSSDANPTFTFPQNGVYPVCVTAFNSCGSATYCDTLKFAIGIAENRLANLLKVFPNPSSGVFSLTFTDELAALPIEVTDLTGKLILRREWTSSSGHFDLTLDLSHLPSGSYLLRVHSTAGIINRKLTIAK